MPFINSKISTDITPEQETTVKELLGQAISVIPVLNQTTSYISRVTIVNQQPLSRLAYLAQRIVRHSICLQLRFARYLSRYLTFRRNACM